MKLPSCQLISWQPLSACSTLQVERGGVREGCRCYGYKNAPLIHTICLSQDRRQTVSCPHSLSKWLQLDAKFKCRSEIGTYKVSLPTSEGFHNGQSWRAMTSETRRQSKPQSLQLEIFKKNKNKKVLSSFWLKMRFQQ